MGVVAILGSSNSQGHTRTLCDRLIQGTNAELLDLNCFSFSPWDYNGGNLEDDFVLIAQRLVLATDLVFCTPVYWYSMSSQMKVFFDRLSDLITRRKTMGRSLAGKRTWLIASGSDADLPQGFEVPFQRTSDYLEMKYCGAFYGSSRDGTFHHETLEGAEAFGRRIATYHRGSSPP